MKHFVRNLVYGCLIFSLLGVAPFESEPEADPTSVQNSSLEAFSLMVSAHTILGDDVNDLLSRQGVSAKAALVLQADTATNPLQMRLEQVKALCAESRAAIQAGYTGAEQCERLAITDQVCAREIRSIETALARSSRGRGLQTFLRRTLRRLDPGRANFGKFLRFVQHDLLPEAAEQYITGALSGGGANARRIVRQVFKRKVRQVIKANLTTDLMMSGVPPQTIQEMGLPASQGIDLSTMKIGKGIDLQAIRQQCDREEGNQATSPESPPADPDQGPDMLEKWLDRKKVQLTCNMPTQYYDTSFVQEGAPEWFDLVVTLDLKEGNVNYTYDYAAAWVSGQYYDNQHHGEGKGSYIGDGWVTGTEVNTAVWYTYYVNIETGEKISAGAEESTGNVPFIGALWDDMSQGVFCRAYPYTNAEIQGIGKEGLLTWNNALCNPCTVEIK
jgi:hypothetical protein